jgi:hypothetical protein
VSIADHIDKFVTYCKSVSGLQAYFGEKTFATAELPALHIQHIDTGESVRMADNSHAMSVPLQVAIIVPKGAHTRGYEAMERTLRRVAQFQADTGVQVIVSEGMSAAEENGQYKVSITVTLRRIVFE